MGRSAKSCGPKKNPNYESNRHFQIADHFSRGFGGNTHQLQPGTGPFPSAEMKHDVHQTKPRKKYKQP